MAKQANSSTLSPYIFITGGTIQTEHVKQTHEMQNYAFKNTVDVMASFNPYNAETNATNPHNLIGISSSTFYVAYRFDVVVDTDYAGRNINVYAMFETPSDTTEARVTVGSANTTISCTAAQSNTLRSGTIAVNSAGTGLQFCTVELRRTGTSNQHYLECLTIQMESPAATSINGPYNS